jgi:hypothetical protein
MSDILKRISHFLGTSPDDTHNRHRMIFFLVVLFCIGIGYELYFDDSAANSTVRESLIKTFSNTITWLVGIYVAGAAAAQLSLAGPSAKIPATKTDPNTSAGARADAAEAG